MIAGMVRYHTTPEQFASYAPALASMGISFIGGCCGTTPEFIRALARTLGRKP
jgi:5-methyltetrahydrofolate--homocysteine methyltransferase